MADYDTGTYESGDARLPTLTVDPADVTTAAVLTLVDPDGTVTTPGQTGALASWTASSSYTLTAGEWVERWTVTGTGKGVQERLIRVAPLTTVVPSGARVYATTADYANYLHASPPQRSRRALWTASMNIDNMLLCAVYDVDDDGMPTDPEVIAAMRDATCAQADYAKTIGDPNGVGASQYHSVSIGSASLARGYNQKGSAAPGRYSPIAFEILQRAGLTAHGPYTT